MFFRRKMKPCNNARLQSFIKRDELTGQRSKAFAESMFLKREKDMSAVAVHTLGEDIIGASVLIASITDCEMYHLGEGYFLLFTSDAQMLSEKLLFFLKSFKGEKEAYAIGVMDKICDIADFEALVEKVKRCTRAAEAANCGQIARELPRI